MNCVAVMCLRYLECYSCVFFFGFRYRIEMVIICIHLMSMVMMLMCNCTDDTALRCSSASIESTH